MVFELLALWLSFALGLAFLLHPFQKMKKENANSESSCIVLIQILSFTLFFNVIEIANHIALPLNTSQFLAFFAARGFSSSDPELLPSARMSSMSTRLPLPQSFNGMVECQQLKKFGMQEISVCMHAHEGRSLPATALVTCVFALPLYAEPQQTNVAATLRKTTGLYWSFLQAGKEVYSPWLLASVRKEAKARAIASAFLTYLESSKSHPTKAMPTRPLFGPYSCMLRRIEPDTPNIPWWQVGASHASQRGSESAVNSHVGPGGKSGWDTEASIQSQLITGKGQNARQLNDNQPFNPYLNVCSTNAADLAALETLETVIRELMAEELLRLSLRTGW